MLKAKVVRFTFDGGVPNPEMVVNDFLTPRDIVEKIEALQRTPSYSEMVEGASGDRGYVTIQSGSSVLHLYVVDEEEKHHECGIRVESHEVHDCGVVTTGGYVGIDFVNEILMKLDNGESVARLIDDEAVQECDGE